MAKIGNFYNEAGAVFNDNSQTLKVHLNNIKAQDGIDEAEAFNEDDVVLINRSDKLSKIDLFRVITALYQCGVFKSSDGKKLTKKRVFKAFEKMLGDDFGNYEKTCQPEATRKGRLLYSRNLKLHLSGVRMTNCADNH